MRVEDFDNDELNDDKLTNDEWVEKYTKEYFAKKREEKAAKKKVYPRRNTSQSVSPIKLPMRKIAKAAIDSASHTISPFATTAATAVAKGQSLGAMDPAGLAATAGNDLLFGVPNRLSPKMRQVERDYEAAHPSAAKTARAVGTAASFAPLPFAPLGAASVGIRAAGRGIAGAAKSSPRLSHFIKGISKHQASRAALENAALGSALAAPQVLTSDNPNIGEALGLSALAGGAVGGLSHGLSKIGGGIWRRVVGRGKPERQRVLPVEYKGLEDSVGKDVIDKSINENIPLVRLLDAKNSGFFKGRAIKTPENLETFKELREASNLGMPETFKREAIDPYLNSENVDTRVARITAQGQRRAAPFYKRTENLEVKSPELLRELSQANPINKIAMKYRAGSPNYRNLKANGYNVGLLNAVKKDLDDKYLKNQKFGNISENIEIIEPARRKALEIIDKVTPLHKRGREISQKYLSNYEQGRRGQEFLNRDNYADWNNFNETNPLKGLTDSQARTFKSGVGSNLYKESQQIATNDTRLNNLNKLRSPAQRKRMNALLGEKTAQKFYDKVDDLIKEQKGYNYISPVSEGIKSAENPRSFTTLARLVKSPFRLMSYTVDKLAKPALPKEYVSILGSSSTLKSLKDRAAKSYDTHQLSSDILRNPAFRWLNLQSNRY
ncbi:MAG: hypothetical protein LBS38_00320 [Endomicrobium sp.]|jgi:hypothetical protein|nr:hypothetical protein [Endomicrobium sp.]